MKLGIRLWDLVRTHKKELILCIIALMILAWFCCMTYVCWHFYPLFRSNAVQYDRATDLRECLIDALFSLIIIFTMYLRKDLKILGVILKIIAGIFTDSCVNKIHHFINSSYRTDEINKDDVIVAVFTIIYVLYPFIRNKK